MSIQDEIKKAIGAHGLWKARLLQAIDTGKSEFLPENVCLDNKCEFGGWLYGATIPASAKQMPDYEVIRKLHGEFHKIAGKVLQLALAGNKIEASKLIGDNSEFLTLSMKLTQAMMKWSATAK